MKLQVVPTSIYCKDWFVKKKIKQQSQSSLSKQELKPRSHQHYLQKNVANPHTPRYLKRLFSFASTQDLTQLSTKALLQVKIFIV